MITVDLTLVCSALRADAVKQELGLPALHIPESESLRPECSDAIIKKSCNDNV